MQNVTQQDGQSADIVSDNIEKLKELFPDAFTEDGVNFDVLRQLLGDADVLDQGEEKYGLNWHGKKAARQIALTPSTGTLLPCPDTSVDWGNTQNIFIEGDNLETLKILQKSYASSIKMIYIDPPYNTGSEFVYPDTYRDNLDTYLRYTGQKDADGFSFSSNTETGGRKHTNWLNMMYPRIKLAKNLLTKDGVIFISIDDNELSNLVRMADEIFGEENRLGVFARRTKSGGGSAAHHFAIEHDYVVSYANQKAFRGPMFIPHEEEYAKRYKETDAIGPYFWDTMARSSTATRPYIIIAPDGTELTGKWFRSETRFKEDLKKGEARIAKLSDGKWSVQFKQRMPEGKKLRSLMHENEYKSRQAELDDLGINGFQHPKPIFLLQRLIQCSTSDDDIVLDFFAGSCSTAHAVMAQNKADGKNRRFIMVQLPEPIEGSDCYSNIAELGRDRIKKAATHLAESGSKIEDSGFKVFKLADSNIRAWNPDIADLEESLLAHREHLVEGRTEQDVLYELLLKRGIELTVPIEERQAAGKTIYSIGYGVLFACLDTSIATTDVDEVAQSILDWHKELAPETDSHVFFRDSAFANDIAKTNMAAILEQNGISHVRSL